MILIKLTSAYKFDNEKKIWVNVDRIETIAESGNYGNYPDAKADITLSTDPESILHVKETPETIYEMISEENRNACYDLGCAIAERFQYYGIGR